LFILHLDVPHELSVQIHLHPLVEILAVGHPHQMRATLAVDQGHERVAFLAPLLAATLHDGTLANRLVVFVRHFVEVLQKVVEGIPFLFPLHPPLITALHLRNVDKQEFEGQTAADIFPVTHHFFFGAKPETHPHQKDAVTHVTHGWGTWDASDRVQPFHFLLGHGHARGWVMKVETPLDRFHLSHREFTPLNHLLRSFRVGQVTFGAGHHLVIGPVGELFLQARPMHPLLATIHQEELIPISHGEFMAQVTSHLTIHRVVGSHFSENNTNFILLS